MNQGCPTNPMTYWKTLLALLIIAIVSSPAFADDIAEGRQLYLRYCASCHGIDGDGNGPLAGSLTTPPPNLRQLSLRYGNPLPRDRIARFIDGRADVKAHGTRDMPVWGERFYAEPNGSEAATRERIRKLVAYLQSIQTGARTASR